MKHYDDYERDADERDPYGKRKHGKGHQRRHGGKCDAYAELHDEDYTPQPDLRIPAQQQQRQDPPPQRRSEAPNPRERSFGPNTRELKGVKIDYDGVDDIIKVENEKGGRMTYGIKFLFKGRKGLFRIVWFNASQKTRNAAYDSERAFWLSLTKKES